MSVIKSCKTAFTLFNSPIISEFGFETVKSHSGVLKNPLINLNEEIQRLEELFKSTSEKQSKVTSALMVPFPLSYNLFATNCAKEVIAAAVPLEEGLSVSQPTKAIPYQCSGSRI
jgi:hypothetical protein